MSDSFSGLDALERSLADVALAESPSAVFRALLDGTRCAAPRAGLLLGSEGGWKGWGSVGYDGAPARRFREIRLSAGNAWAEATVSEPDGFARGFGAAAGLGSFGQPEADESVALAVRIGGRAVALLVAERGAGESPWHPDALRILGHAVRLRLELDLAWRRLRTSPRQPEIPPAERTPPIEPAGPAERPAPPPAPAAVEETALEPAAPVAEAERPLEDARRFARLVATDIRLYNEEGVLLGRKHRDLVQRLADPIEQGRATFRRRFPDLGDDGVRVLQDAFVQVLAGGDETLLVQR